MPTAINKQRVFTQLLAGSSKTARAEPELRPVLEQFLYAVCREDVTRDLADRAFRNLQEQFFDWNEIRVSSNRELADAMDGLPQAEARAQRIIEFLQEVFETTYSFDLESLHKKGLKQAAKQLSRYHAANDFAVAWVTQQSLGGHAIPLDDASLRVLRRLGLIEGDEDNLENLRGGLEHQIPKSKGSQFNDVVIQIAEDYCYDRDPHCSACPLVSSCPTGQEAKAPAHAGARNKPR